MAAPLTRDPSYASSVAKSTPPGAAGTAGPGQARILTESDGIVPEPYLVAIRQDEIPSILWEYAGEILHHHLVRCARANANLDRAMGRVLRRIRALDVGKLGFARFGDYLRERTGLGVRWAQKLVRLDDALRRLPGLAEAHRTGRLTTSKVLALLPVVTRDDEASWCARARELTVRGIEAAVRARARAETAAPPMSESAGRPDPAAGDPPRTAAGEAQPEAGAGRAPATAAEIDAGAAEEEAGVAEETSAERMRLRLDVPTPMLDFFDHAIEIARRVVGENEPIHRCFEHLLAEFLAGSVGESQAGTEPHAPPAATAARPHAPPFSDVPPDLPVPQFQYAEYDPTLLDDEDVEATSSTGASRRLRRWWPDLRDPASRATFERRLEELTNRWSFLKEPEEILLLDPAVAGENDPPDVFALDERLRRLVRLRQRWHGEMASLLSNFKRLGLPRKACFASLGHFGREALGISPRLAADLVYAYRRFFDLPEVGKAYWSGEITWSQVRCLLGVCRPDTQAAWIARAKEVTVRRLELEARHVRRLKEVDPRAWARGGGPPPLSTLPPRASASSIRPGAGLWEPDVSETLPDAGEARIYDTGDCELVEADWDGEGRWEDDACAGYSDDDMGEVPCPGDDRQGDDRQGEPSDPWYDMGDGDDLVSHLLEPEVVLTDSEIACPDPEPLGGHRLSPALQMCSRARMRRLDIWVPPATLDLWKEAQTRVARAAGRPVQPWQCLLAVLTDFLRKWDDPENVELPVRHRIFLRDGYQCTAPGCGARRGLEIHHIVPRSRGGTDDPENLTVLCAAHHRRVLHAGWMRGTGTAPGDVTWELGVRTGCAPLDVYRGDVRIRGPAGSSDSAIWNCSR
jgi:hypothetical protein